MHSRASDAPDLSRRSLLAVAAMAPALAVAGNARAAPSAPVQSAALPADLARALNAYDLATIRNDIAMLGQLVAEDYLLVNSDSSLQDKQSYLDDFKVPGFKVDPYEIEHPVYKVWGDTALTGGLLHLGWTLDGEHQSRLLRVAHVWARQDGHWRMTYTQLTRVPD